MDDSGGDLRGGSRPIVAADDHRLAASLASEAGRLLLALREEMRGAPPEELRAQGDRRSHQHLLAALAARRPDDAVLSEESPDDGRRLTARRVWIVDPLDGTREYAEPGRLDWAVHVALVVGGVLTAAAVALPALGTTLATWPPPPPPPFRPGPIRLAVSRTRPPTVTSSIQHGLHADLVPMGSAGAKAMSVVMGDVDVYAHAGGQHEWDSAAPVAVAAAAGLHVSRLDGSPLRYNQPDPWLPDLLVCRPELASSVVAAAGGAS